jgi:peptide/nickel transport system ATP-binding protein
MSLLEVKHLSFSAEVRSFARKMRKRILRDVSLSLEEGETLGLIGESGSGKTSFARCIVGLYEPDGGVINFAGTNIYPEKGNRKAIGGKIQLLFQNHASSLDPRLSIRKSLLEGATGSNSAELEAFALKLAAMVELPEDILDRHPQQLSGGQRQRVALARTLSVSPRLLILDEPTSALDALTQVQVLKMIKNVQASTGTAILYISHDVLSASLVCDRMAVLYEGIVAEIGETTQLLRKPQHPYTRRIVDALPERIGGK